MSEKGAPDALALTHAETPALASGSTALTGGPMLLHASADTEEKTVSYLAARSLFLCFSFLPSHVLIWAPLKSSVKPKTTEAAHCGCQSGPAGSRNVVHSSLFAGSPIGDTRNRKQGMVMDARSGTRRKLKGQESKINAAKGGVDRFRFTPVLHRGSSMLAKGLWTFGSPAPVGLCTCHLPPPELSHPDTTR